MRRFILFIFILALIISFSSCSGGSKNIKHRTHPSTSVKQSGASTLLDTSQESIVDLIDQGLYAFPDLNFAIWFPQEPVRQLDTVRESGFLINFHTVISKTSHSAYMVAVAQYPTDAIKDVSTEDLLKNVMNGFVNSLGMNVTSTRLEKFKGKPGLFYTGLSGGNYYYIQVVVDGTTVYQIALLSAGQELSKSDIDKYFGSFRFIHTSQNNQN